MLTALKNIGLSDKEAKVYIAMLELGAATVLEIAAKAGINRPTAYVEIEALKKKGLASSQTKGIKKLFIAESPTQLEFVLDREAKEVDAKKSELAKVLPELSTLFNLADEKPQVRFFEGADGVLTMLEELLKTKDKLILSIFHADAVLNVFPKHLDTYTPRRVQKGIHAKNLYTSAHGPILAKDDKEMLRESKFISSDKLPINIDISVFDDKVAISSLRGRVSAALITNSDMANSFRGIFDLLWHAADKL